MKDRKTDFNDEINRPKTIPFDRDKREIGMSTMQISRKKLLKEIPVTLKAYLEISGLPKGPTGFELKRRETLIGRGRHCQLILPAMGISRRHARIVFRDEEYFIEDLESTNGTYVNNIKVIKCVLRSHDYIEIGVAKIVFVEERTRNK